MKDLGTAPVIAYASAGCRRLLSGRRLVDPVRHGNVRRAPPHRRRRGLRRRGLPRPGDPGRVPQPGPFPDSRSAGRGRRRVLRRHVVPDAAAGRPGHAPGLVGAPLSEGTTPRPELVRFVAAELDRVRRAVGRPRRAGPSPTRCWATPSARPTSSGRSLARIRDLSYGTTPAPFPALETQICEMLALHFCSDLDECILVLEDVLRTVEARVAAGEGVLGRRLPGRLGQSRRRPPGHEPVRGDGRRAGRDRISLSPRPGPDPRGRPAARSPWPKPSCATR